MCHKYPPISNYIKRTITSRHGQLARFGSRACQKTVIINLSFYNESTFCEDKMKLGKTFALCVSVGWPLLSQIAPAGVRLGVPPIAHVSSVGEIQGEGCTSILVGRLASADGSTMTSHSCDSGTDRT
jgi:hypothetical protein